MSQHDYSIANAAGATVRADINSALSAIASNNSGSSEPSTTFAYEWWVDTSTGALKLRNSGNSGWVTMPFSISSDNTVDINGGTVNGITSLSFSSGATVASILDEDNLSSDSATALATQQSIKAYVDSQVTAQDLDISDGSSTIAIDLDSETLSLLGGTGITSTASGNGVTFAIGQSVGTSDNVVFNQVTAALVGNASTATALATARTISGVSFDGTANITLDTDDIGEGSNKYYTAERVDDQVNTLLTAGTGITLTYNDGAGTLTIDGQTGDITSVVAGDGLTGSGTSGDVTLTVEVDDSSIEINSDALRVKASGITNAMLGGSIANAKLANSSITINSQAIALGGSHTFDTDDIGEGSSNLYYTTARANSAIDARVTNTFINDLTGVVADTATALATGRTIALSGDVTATGVSFDGTGNITLSTTIAANSVALGTDTTGNYVATIADAGNTRITVANSGSETAAITLDIADDAIGTDQIANNAVALGTQSTGNYVATIAGTTNEIEVSGSGSETAAVTIGLPDNVTIAGNLTVNGTTTTVNTSTLEVEDPLIKLAKSNSGADSVDIGFYGLYDTSGSQDLYAGLFRDASDSGKFKLFKDLQAEPTTTVNTSGTGYAGGTLVATFEGSLTGNVTGQVSTLSNHDTDNLSEGSSNLYFTNARARSAISASGDISYNSSTGVISFTQSTAPVTSVNSATGAVVLDTDDIAEGSNLYMTTERVQDIAGGMVTGNTETGITVTYDDSDGTLDFVVGTLNQDTTGNAATATALETARTIGGVSFDGTGNIDLAGVNTSGNQDTSGNAATATALAAGRTIGMTGDVVWTSASFDGSGNVTGTATIQANSVALGTDTTGDYVSTITAGTGLTSTGATSGEGVAHSLSVDAAQTQITSVGALDGGSITSGFGSIDVGSSAITTTGTITGGTLAGTLSTAAQTNITSVGTLSTLTVDNVIINGTTIGHTSDTDLMTLADGVLTVAGELDATSLDISGNADIDGTLETDNLTIGGSQGSDGQVLTSTGSGVAWEDSSGGVAGISSSADATAITIGSDELVTFSAGLTSTAAANTLGATSFSEADLTNVGTIYADQYLGDADTDSGIVLPGSNVMTLHTNNSERMRIAADGNIGFNTSDVTVGSSVSGSSTATPKFITYNNDYSSGYTDASLKLYLFNSGTTRQGFTSGPSYDLQYHSSGSDAGRHAFHVANTEIMRINKTQVGIGDSSVIASNTTSTLAVRKDTSAGRGGEISIVNYAATAVGNEAALNFGLESSTYDSDNGNFQIKARVMGSDAATDAVFSNWSGSAFKERMRLKSNGTFYISEDLGAHSGTYSFAHNTYDHAAVFGANSTPLGTVVIEDYDVSSGVGNTVLNCYLRDEDPATYASFIKFTDGGGTVGSVTHNDDGGGVSFNTTSDYRLKENVNYDWEAIPLLNQLKPAKFNFKRNPAKTIQGMLAHEVADIVPSSVRGNKDHMEPIGTIKDSDGNIVYEGVYEHFTKTDKGQTWTKTGTEPLYQELDYSRLVPLLTKALQEQQEQIDALQSEINTLKGE